MSDLTPLLDGSRTPGVYRSAGDDPVDIRLALTRAGWSVAILGAVTTTHAFYDEVTAALALPQHFGRNLDALWDCLTDLDLPTALIWTDWIRFAEARPNRWPAILGLFVDRCERSPEFAVVLA